MFTNPMGIHLSSPELQSMMQDKMFASSGNLQEAWIRMGLQNQARLHLGNERGSDWSAEFANSMAQGKNFAASSSTSHFNDQYSNMNQNCMSTLLILYAIDNDCDDFRPAKPLHAFSTILSAINANGYV